MAPSVVVDLGPLAFTTYHSPPKSGPWPWACPAAESPAQWVIPEKSSRMRSMRQN